MLVHHLARLLVRHFAVKGIDRPVVRALLSPAVLRLFQLILFELARELAQVRRALPVRHALLGVIGVRRILRHVTRPDSFLPAFRRTLAREVADVRGCRPASAHFDRDERPTAHLTLAPLRLS